MTTAEQLAALETMTTEHDQAVLSTYLGIAGGIVLRKAFPFGDGTEEIPAKYQMAQVEIAAYLIQKRGAEGETQHSEGGISRMYEDGDVPPTLLRRILPEGRVL